MAFNPDLQSIWNVAQGALSNYFSNVKQPQQISGLENLLTAVGPYREYQWKQPDYKAPVYNDPAAYQATQFNLKPVAEEQWKNRKTEARENISNQYKGTRERVVDETLRTPTRASQAAALLANLGVQEEAAQTNALRGIGVDQANQALDVEKWQQENNAREMAQKYGLDVDASRFMFNNQTDDARFRAGMSQWQQEQQAAERQMAYQSRYGLAQDIAQTRMNQFEANRAANTDYQNALLQGQQAATQGFSQAGTYYTNLTKDERDEMKQPSNTFNSYNTYSTPTSYRSGRIYGTAGYPSGVKYG